MHLWCLRPPRKGEWLLLTVFWLQGFDLFNQHKTFRKCAFTLLIVLVWMHQLV